MRTLHLDTDTVYGSFKPLNATNGGPWHKRHANDQYRTNLPDYKAARIPYARNHDSCGCGIYGGPFAHDVSVIFPDFSADVNDPASYDFACTDESILVTLEAGTKTFFRLGETIEHHIKKHHTVPPADFQKWAEICEHIIRHYTEGWADGFSHDMPYWEIWNEADLDSDDSENKRCWGGTKAQFFDFYETAAKHLKKCFPNLKIGGPASCGRAEWCDDFLREMKKRNVPIDFFSWHIYTNDPVCVNNQIHTMKEIAVRNGYGDAESILNEWNYNCGWGENYVESLKTIHSMKGAAFTMAVMSLSQKAPVDMLMYYDTRPSVFNGLFDFYTYEKLKGYYPFIGYSKFYDMENEIRVTEEDDKNIYTIFGKNKNGKIYGIVTYFTDEKNMSAEKTEILTGDSRQYEIRIVDETHDYDTVTETEKLSFEMTPNSIIFIEEK